MSGSKEWHPAVSAPVHTSVKLSFEQQLLLFVGVAGAGAALGTFSQGVLWFYGLKRPSDASLLPTIGGSIGVVAFFVFAVWYNAGWEWGVLAAVGALVAVIAGTWRKVAAD